MSEPLLFDALTGSAEPAAALGARVKGPEVEARFAAVVAQAEASLQSFFGVTLATPPERAAQLDELVRGLWAAQWDPQSANADLFTLHFGAILMDAALKQGGCEGVFRSDRELTHASLWFAPLRVELFPFHKAFKAITRGPQERLGEFQHWVTQLGSGVQ